MVRRTAALPGDLICVTGTIGDAALGLALRASPPWSGAVGPDHRAHLADRYLHPRPRIAFATALREHAHAAMDVSDGLVGDLAKLCRASQVSAEIEAERVPLSAAAAAALAADPRLLEPVLTGGDDYEILCTIPPERVPGAKDAALAAGFSLTAIGAVREGSAPPLIRVNGAARRFARGSFSHFE
jgi:thiamine-monophosphate kinase